MKNKNISNCTKANCKGQKVQTRNPIGYVCDTCELPKLIEANKPPRTGRVEKKGDREKLEKVLKKIHQNETTTHSLPKKKHIDEKTLKKLEKLAKKIREEESKILKKINKKK